MKEVAQKNKLSQLVTLIAPYKKTFWKATEALFLVAIINLSIPAAIKLYVPSLGEDTSSSVFQLACILIVLFLLQGIFGYFRIYFFNILGHQVIADLRSNLFRSILNQEFLFFEKHRSGDLISRLNADTQSLQEVLSTKISILLRYTVQVIGGVLLMFFISAKLTFFIILTLPIIVLISLVLARKLKNYSSQIQSEMGQAAVLAEESFAGIKILKVFQKTDLLADYFHTHVQNILKLACDRTKVSSFFQSVVSFILYSLIVVFLVYGVQLAELNQMSLADLTAFILYTIIVAISFSFLANTMDDFSKGIAAMERILEAANQQKTTYPEPSNLQDICEVEFQNISFKYPSRKEEVLTKLNLHIPKNQLTVITGPSGCGKSTIINLILGFYNPSNGTILVNQKNLENQESDFIKSISYVPQNPTIFDLSIRENLLLGNENATQEEIEQICDSLNLLEFIKQLPDQFNTVCGSHGVQLSLGQQQRLAIARAVLKKAPLLILDEATSSLDSENEQRVIDLVKDYSKSHTVLMITHRLSVIKDAKQIIMIEYPGKTLSGKHEELLEQSDLYNYIVKQQSIA